MCVWRGDESVARCFILILYFPQVFERENESAEVSAIVFALSTGLQQSVALATRSWWPGPKSHPRHLQKMLLGHLPKLYHSNLRFKFQNTLLKCYKFLHKIWFSSHFFSLLTIKLKLDSAAALVDVAPWHIPSEVLRSPADVSSSWVLSAPRCHRHFGRHFIGHHSAGSNFMHA